ncbi:recombination protein NinG [Metapseudomonas otitidis]|uniref:recombination protein NinG n=1 Tax=Metapseudomonas otitidis TaxID=319939 RepID=UPI0024492EA5|nr:recombination protein NinG [Pseudomonas otitidis]MDH0335169.1 recombination protein NinG [Pseudomonas otitidis]
MSKPKKCRNCRESFIPVRALQVVCSPTCALEYQSKKKAQARKSLEAMERKELKVRKKALKKRGDYMREAQQAFNAFIRARDEGQPCISCDSTTNDDGLITGSRWDAGHYRSVGACHELRFEPLNCHAQCVRCNRNLSGNTVEYRIRLVQRIGLDKVEWLEGPHEPRRWTIPELEQIKAHYRALVRQMKKDAA